MLIKRVDQRLKVLAPSYSRVMPVTFSYQADRPWQVDLVFTGEPGRPSWMFSRDLLRSGLTEAVGDGDVIIFPHDRYSISITLAAVYPRDTSLVILAPQPAVRKFLAATDGVVPPGDERMKLDLDGELRKLLGA